MFCARNIVLVNELIKIFQNKCGQVVSYKLYYCHPRIFRTSDGPVYHETHLSFTKEIVGHLIDLIQIEIFIQVSSNKTEKAFSCKGSTISHSAQLKKSQTLQLRLQKRPHILRYARTRNSAVVVTYYNWGLTEYVVKVGNRAWRAKFT